jgi:hypothetical protein
MIQAGRKTNPVRRGMDKFCPPGRITRKDNFFGLMRKSRVWNSNPWRGYQKKQAFRLVDFDDKTIARKKSIIIQKSTKLRKLWRANIHIVCPG